jgi:hypothetical protein
MGKYNSGVLNALDERCKTNYIFMQTIKKKMWFRGCIRTAVNPGWRTETGKGDRSWIFRKSLTAWQQ